MHSSVSGGPESVGEPALSIATVAALFGQLHLDLIVLDEQLEPRVVIRRGADVLERLSRARRRELAQRVAASASGSALSLIKLDDAEDSGIELGAFPLSGGIGIVIAGPGNQRFPAADGLRRFYGLTPTESKVARAISSGRSPKQIAGDLEVELSTVRTHLRAVHVKLGAASQADLIRRLLSSVTTFMIDASEVAVRNPSSLVTTGDATSQSTI